ncbi:hypothetical protein [Candidatus Caldatribacterium sp.]|uniref:hypothetical protein n=1 Tax=Candidatus Caldatribacterium sp. TaxID=2282143 RepID=UPI00383F20E9|nr:hypothetical protein [Candidatus Caldatribacterium sp.]
MGDQEIFVPPREYTLEEEQEQVVNYIPFQFMAYYDQKNDGTIVRVYPVNGGWVSIPFSGRKSIEEAIEEMRKWYGERWNRMPENLTGFVIHQNIETLEKEFTAILEEFQKASKKLQEVCPLYDVGVYYYYYRLLIESQPNDRTRIHYYPAFEVAISKQHKQTKRRMALSYLRVNRILNAFHKSQGFPINFLTIYYRPGKESPRVENFLHATRFVIRAPFSATFAAWDFIPFIVYKVASKNDRERLCKEFTSHVDFQTLSTLLPLAT